MTHPTSTPRSGPVVGVVLAALATGALGALGLLLLAFPGAREHTTTGVALLAFAAGWAVLHQLSTRFTAQPQRWAAVPAVAMAGAGLTVLVSAPGTQALTKTGWVWPPLLLALAVWSAVQLRRAMTSRARWLLQPVLALMALAAVGGAVETVALAHDEGALAMPGRRYDVGDHSLHLSCTGAGSPTVVLLNGTGEVSASWARVVPQVAATTRVCAYDRAGQGWSDDASLAQDGLGIVRDLRALLQAAGEQSPYLLVGHSAGGVYGMTYAAHHPGEVAGLVLLDASSPRQFTVLPDFEGEYAMMRRAFGVLPSVARLGLGRLVSSDMFSTLPQPAAGQVRAFGTSSRGLASMRDESSRYRDSFRQAQALRTLGAKPLAVVTATGSLTGTPGWAAAQAELVALSTDALHVVADTSHEGLLVDASGAARSADAVVRAVRAVRTGDPVGPA